MQRYPTMLAVSVLGLISLITGTAPAATIPQFIATAVADPGRPGADIARDANRKPAETLVFAEVKAGDQIAELIPGGGYFTRLFSKAVGAKGHVYALVPAPSANAPADMPDFAARVKLIAADPAYANVSVVVVPFGELQSPKPVDLVWTSQNYHDLHNMQGMDVSIFNRLVFETLKPGGLYVVLDHTAAAGSGLRDTSTLHRIDPAVVKSEVLAAGFEFVGSSDELKNPADDLHVKVFDPSVRGKTDQFLLKFRKPGMKQ